MNLRLYLTGTAVPMRAVLRGPVCGVSPNYQYYTKLLLYFQQKFCHESDFASAFAEATADKCATPGQVGGQELGDFGCSY
jgi:hypothetical protein